MIVSLEGYGPTKVLEEAERSFGPNLEVRWVKPGEFASLHRGKVEHAGCGL